MDNSLQRRLPQELELSVYEVARKEIVLKQDTYCNHLYVLLKGELEVNIVDVAGNLVKVERYSCSPCFCHSSFVW